MPAVCIMGTSIFWREAAEKHLHNKSHLATSCLSLLPVWTDYGLFSTWDVYLNNVRMWTPGSCASTATSVYMNYYAIVAVPHTYVW